MASTRYMWSRNSEALLLELVREKRLLWDPKDYMYHKTKLRQEAFKSVAEALKVEFPELSQLNGDQVRMKFKNLRTYFLHQRRKIRGAPSGSAGCPGVTWPLYGAASYLAGVRDDLTSSKSTYKLPSNMSEEQSKDHHQHSAPLNTMALAGAPPSASPAASEEQHKCVFCGHQFPSKPELQTHFRLHANGIIDIKGHPKVRQKVDSRPTRTSARTTTTTTTTTTTKPTTATTTATTTTTTTTTTSGKSSAVCDVCGEAFHTVSLAISHKFRKHPDSVAKHYCPHCGMMFPIKLSRDKHLILHSSAPPKQLFPCRPCGVTFYNQPAMKFHMDSAHKGATRMVNPVRTPAPSMKIVVNNAGEPLSVYYCHLCGCEYQVKYNLQKHLATKHNQGERDALPKELVQCNLCSAVFYSKRAYEAHSHHHRDGDLFATNEQMRQQVVQRIDQDFDHRRVPTPVERYLSASAVTSNRSATWRNIQAARRAQTTSSSSTMSSSSSSTSSPVSVQSIPSSSSSSSLKVNKKEDRRRREEEEEEKERSSSSSSSARLKEEEEEEEEEEREKKIPFLTNTLPLRGGGGGGGEEEGGGRGGGGTQGDFLPWAMDDGRRKRRRTMMDESEEEEEVEVMWSLGNVNPDTILSRGLMRREEEEKEEEERKTEEEEEVGKKQKRRCRAEKFGALYELNYYLKNY